MAYAIGLALGEYINVFHVMKNDRVQVLVGLVAAFV